MMNSKDNKILVMSIICEIILTCKKYAHQFDEHIMLFKD